MKNLLYSLSQLAKGLAFCLWAGLLAAWTPPIGISGAADAVPKPAAAAEDKIHVTADKLISDNEARQAEFIGNVRAWQGANLITSDRLKIFYKRQLDRAAEGAAGEEAIEKIVATGNVAIRFENRVAEAEQAVYNTATQVMVLTGERARVSSGGNYISGPKITVHRTDGRMIVESDPARRVEAVFYSEQKEADDKE